MADFHSDLAFGTDAERRVVDTLLKAGYWACWANAGEAQDIAAIINGYCQKLEIKNERYDNGRIFIEIERFGHASGFTTSEASAYIHCLPSITVAYRTGKMRAFLFDEMRIKRITPFVVKAEPEKRIKGVLLEVSRLQGRPWAWTGRLEDLAQAPIWGY